MSAGYECAHEGEDWDRQSDPCIGCEWVEEVDGECQCGYKLALYAIEEVAE